MAALEERIALMVLLGKYLLEQTSEWQNAIEVAERQNGWFTPAYTRMAADAIAYEFLREDKLVQWLDRYPAIKATDNTIPSKIVGIVMAGNIPLVGFHDFLCGYISGHKMKIKLSSKDTVLWEHLLKVLNKWDEHFNDQVTTSDMLKNCDAYIATGSNNSARYFEQYFQKYPHIIRKNRSSVAILDGKESEKELEAFSDDVCTYFGLGCRNITKVYVPQGYSFETLLPAFDKYKHHLDHNKYKNNYDYQLALYLLNKIDYMSNGSILLVPSESIYAPISVLHYEYYTDTNLLLNQLVSNDSVQCIAVREPATDNSSIYPSRIKKFGDSQYPQLNDYADGIDTLRFLLQIDNKG